MNEKTKNTGPLEILGEALKRLGEVLEVPENENDYVVDATIQRFEFVVELFWKTLKHLLAKEGRETSTPKEALQEAFAAKWINDEKTWLSMLQDRNLTSHTYRQDYAHEIYARVKTYYPEMQNVYKLLDEKFGA